MARNRIEELLVQLKFEGSEELRKVASGFRDLGRATTLTDTQIQSARRQINDYAKSLSNSEQALRGQIQALQTLRTQATVGGNVYSQLANDVTRLSKTLKGLEEDYKAVGRAAEQTDRQIANQFPARRPEAFRIQLAALRRELDGISVSARAYGDKLTEITIREAAFGRAQARQGVIAGAQAVGAPLIGAMTPEQELPKTTAALSLRLVELREDLQNTNYTLRDYKQRLDEIKVVQQELDRVTGEANKARKDEINDRIANLKAINAENDALRARDAVSRSIERNRAKRAGIAGRGLTGEMFGPEAPSELFRFIGAISDQGGANAAQLMGRTYGEVAQQIRNVAASSDGSINSLQRQRAAWQQLRTTISPLSADYGKVAKEADRAMAAIDRQVQRMQGRRRLGAMEATQAAGAVISGGIFGGPEGAAGGIAGTVVGGVPGAFAGAAIGAQFGMIRQAIGSYAEMSAEINQLRQGLAASSNNFAEFTRLVQMTEESSKRLLIPLAASYRIMAQLRANTVELGYSLEDTRMLFEGTATAVFQTGGNLNDVQGAMRAIVQVLSKGRPQAEEIRSQLGERLPGAIIKFAQETGRSTEELEQAFKDSAVTVDDFFKFAKRNFKDGEGYFDNLATNAEFAGRRYEKSLENIKLTLGRTFQTSGAAFQDFATRYLGGLDRILNKLIELRAIQPGSQFFVEQVLSGALSIDKLEQQLLEAGAKYDELKQRTGSLAPLFPEFGALGAETKSLEDALIILRRFESQSKERETQQEKETKQKQQEQAASSFLQAVEQRENAIAQARIQLEEQAGEIRKQAVEGVKRLEESFAQQRLSKEREIAQARRELAGVQQDIGFELSAVQAAATGGDPEIIRIQQRIAEAARQRDEERIQLEQTLLDEQAERNKAIEELKTSNATAINEANLRYTKAIGDAQREYARAVAKIIEEGTERAGKRLEAAGKIMAAYIKRATLNQQIAGGSDFVIPEPGADGDYSFTGIGAFTGADLLDAQAFKDVRLPLKALLKLDKDIARFSQSLSAIPAAAAITGPAISSITVNIDDLLQGVNKAALGLKGLSAQSAEAFKALGDAKFGQAFTRESAQALQGILGLTQNLRSEQEKALGVLSLREGGLQGDLAERVYDINQSFEAARDGLDAAFRSASALTTDPKKLTDLKTVYDTLTSSLFDAKSAALGFAEALAVVPPDLQIRIAIQDMGDELNKLMAPASQVISVATAIGDAFGNSFKGVITGSMTAREALASFFSSVADSFADMAAKMIAEWIKLAILNTVLKLFPGFGGAGAGLSDLSAPATINNPLGVLNANGNAFASNNIIPYANGGIVNRPTMFKFARGGAMATGVMGEAGPEAIMPLKRGADGKLGVASAGASGVTVNVSVDAKGTQVQGDPGQGAQLGRVIAGAVQQELIKQQRPGGLLAGAK